MDMLGLYLLLLAQLIEILEHASGSLDGGCRALELKAATATVDLDAQSLLDLAQMSIELTAEIRHAARIGRLEVDVDRLGLCERLRQRTVGPLWLRVGRATSSATRRR